VGKQRKNVHSRIENALNLVIPAKAGIQERHLETTLCWIPACAGMTKEKLCRVHRPAAGAQAGSARRYISLSHKWKRGKKKEPLGSGSFLVADVWTGRIYIIPSMPPMPPMPPPAGMGVSSLGASATMASVVSIRPATEAAFCSAVRVTLVGSRMPISIMSP